MIKEWFKKPWHIHAMECYSATKKDKLLIHATIRINFQRIMLNEKSQFQMVSYHMIPFIYYLKTKLYDWRID